MTQGKQTAEEKPKPSNHKRQMCHANKTEMKMDKHQETSHSITVVAIHILFFSDPESAGHILDFRYMFTKHNPCLQLTGCVPNK